MQMFKIPKCRLDLSHIMTNDVEHVIKLPSKGWISILIGNYLENINPRELHQIWILFRALDHAMDLKPKTQKELPYYNQQLPLCPIYQFLQVYKPMYIIFQVHLWSETIILIPDVFVLWL